jgi:mRNA-degrading endonuclease RelE of RelBE toxin-antitoxin system
VHHIETSPHLEDALRRLPARDRQRVLTVLRDVLPLEPLPANVDIKALKGGPPWLRLRIGDWRVVFRPLTRRELVAISRRRERVTTGGYYVETVVNRRELRRTARRLP